MKKILPILILLILSTIVRLWWLKTTNYTAEDSFITFQFSRNIFRGGGFSLNFGVPVYGSTTPLLSLLLAGWLFLSRDIVLGSRIIDMVAVLGGMVFLYGSFSDKRTAFIALFIIALSSRLYVEEMQGMETPLTFLFLAASFYGFRKQLPVFAGIMAGLLLWTRVDTVFWVVTLFVIYLILDYKQSFKYFLATTAVYLPWIIFSWLYFGSPVPLTIVAKQIAYGLHSSPPLTHLLIIIKYVSWPVIILAILSIPATMKNKYFSIFAIFAVVEITQLIFFGTTYFARYFYLFTLVCYIILGFGISDAIRQTIMRSTDNKRYLWAITLLVVAVISFPRIYSSATNYHNHFDGVNVHIGQWLNSNTPPGSTVLLEPLGYVGWYADRYMIDEVGLVTPKVVELNGKIPGSEFFRVFWPDYVVWTCNGGGKVRSEIAEYYSIVQIFGDQSRSCLYEVWESKELQVALYR